MGKHYERRLKQMSETWKAYIAGLIDCDGSIIFNKYSNSYKIVIVNTKRVLPYKLARITGLKNIYKINKEGKPDGWNRKPLYRWEVVARMDVYELLRELLPYFVVKRDKAKEAFKYMANLVSSKV